MHVGLIGTGRIGVFHARTLARNPRVDRMTVTDADRRRASKVAEELGAGRVDTAAELLRSGIDAVVIAAATPAHAELLRLAADAGVPAFCEKPIALDLEATDAVIEHIERTDAFVQIGFQRRFDRGYVAARAAVRDGSIGDVRVLRLATHDPAPPPEDYIAASGGIWLDLAIHDFDIAPWVLGTPIVEVFADGQANDPLFARHGDVDTATAMLRFEDGVLGVVTAARRDPRGYDVRMEVFGLRDSVAVGADGRTALRSVEPGVEAPAGAGYADFLERFADAYGAELAAFLDAVAERTESPCSVAEARQALVVALAAHRSQREHRPVAIKEIA